MGGAPHLDTVPAVVEHLAVLDAAAGARARERKPHALAVVDAGGGDAWLGAVDDLDVGRNKRNSGPAYIKTQDQST